MWEPKKWPVALAVNWVSWVYNYKMYHMAVTVLDLFRPAFWYNLIIYIMSPERERECVCTVSVYCVFVYACVCVCVCMCVCVCKCVCVLLLCGGTQNSAAYETPDSGLFWHYENVETNNNNNNGHFYGAWSLARSRAQCAVQKAAEKKCINTYNGQDLKIKIKNKKVSGYTPANHARIYIQDFQ